MRYAAAESEFGASPTKENLKRVKSYADTARGALAGYAKGNGGVSKTAPIGYQRWAKAVSDQIWLGQRSAEDIEKRTRGE